MEQVTAEQVEREIKFHNITFWTRRHCSICDAPLRYFFENNKVYYTHYCDCLPGPPVLRSYQEVADTLNYQTPENRQKLWRELLMLREDESNFSSEEKIKSFSVLKSSEQVKEELLSMIVMYLVEALPYDKASNLMKKFQELQQALVSEKSL